MKFNKILPIISIILISLLAFGAVSASDDNATDIMEVSDIDEEIQTVDIVEDQNADEVLSDGEDNADDVQMNIAVENATYDEQVSINITVTDNTHSIDFTQSTVEMFVNDKYIANAPISSTGQSGCALALGELDVGTYCVKATLLNGTDRVTTGSAFFSVDKAIPTVNVSDVTVNVYEPVTIPLTVTDKRGNPISGDAIVTIFWQSDSLSKRVSVVDGNASAAFDFTDIIGIISSMSMGDMMAMFGGSDSGGMNWEEMFGGNGTNWMDMFGGNGTGGNGSNWMDMFGGNGTNWMDMFGGNGTNWEEMFGGNGSGNMMEGMMSVTFEYIFTPGNYNVTTTFLSNRNYATANVTSNLLITYLEDVVYFADISVPKKLGDKTNVTITVVDKYTNPIQNITVTAVVDDSQEVNATLNDKGTAAISFDNLVSGNHKLVLKSNANGSLTTQSFDFNVPLIKANVTITAKAISVNAVNTAVDGKIGKYFSATLKDELGNVLAGKKVQISINNKKYTVTTNKNGVAKLQLNIAKAGVYTCSVAFLSDDNYNGAFNIAKVTVKKQTAKLATAKKTYKAKAKTKKLTATFKSAKGKAIKGKKITFKVKGKTYTAKTNAKGVATVKVKLTKKGKYTFTAKFAGDNTYKAVTKKAKLILN